MIKQLSTKITYQNKWMTVREDNVEFANGAKGIFGVVEKPDFALVIPWFGDGFQLVKQYRYPVQESFWEFPQGMYEDKPDTDPFTVACGELKEETGITAGSVTEIGFLYEAYGYSNQGFHVFLASELQQGEQQLGETEQDIVTKRFSVSEFEAMVIKGEIRDAPTLSAYALFKIKTMF